MRCELVAQLSEQGQGTHVAAAETVPLLGRGGLRPELSLVLLGRVGWHCFPPSVTAQMPPQSHVAAAGAQKGRAPHSSRL